MINGKPHKDGSFDLTCDRCDEPDNLIIQDNGEELCERCDRKVNEEKQIEEETQNLK